MQNDRAPPRRSVQEHYRFNSAEAEKLYRRVGRVFDSLPRQEYLGTDELKDFSFFRSFFAECIHRIDEKIEAGQIIPQDTRGFPQESRIRGHKPRVAVFIGSFDPFQMSHLAMTLRFLASEKSRVDIVYVIPEGARDARKPGRTDYRFRYDLLESQLKGVFEPFVLPFDLGADSDTIGIVERLLAWYAGSELTLTHVVGSDVLPLVVKYLPVDMDRWTRASRQFGVTLDFSIFVMRRKGCGRLSSWLAQIRKLGIHVDVDMCTIGTPSSTDFRKDRAVTIAFPTDAMLSRLEILFRYSMNTPWIHRKSEQPHIRRWEI